MERPQAKKTAYVGQLADGKRLGYWLLVLTTPFRGRAIPFHLITYPANTISTQGTSRNQEHFRAVAAIKSLLGGRPLVLDREFSCLELCHSPVTERIHFVIRLKIGLQQVSLLDHEVQPIKLVAQSGKSVIYLIEILCNFLLALRSVIVLRINIILKRKWFSNYKGTKDRNFELQKFYNLHDIILDISGTCFSPWIRCAPPRGYER